MALQVWLPMLGSIDNQGISNLPNSTVNTMEVISSGKIGKCMKGNLLYHYTTDPLPGDYSFATWYKYDFDFPTGNIIIYCKNTSGTNDSQCYFSIYQSGTKLRYLGIDDISYNYSFQKSTWYHLAITCKSNVISMYINGSLVKTTSVSATPSSLNLGIGCRASNASGTSYVTGGNGTFNDVRVYDHCLSPKEVELLARGLVVHYPMTDGRGGQENILIGTMRKEFTTSNSQSRSLGILYAGSGGNGVFSVTDDTTVPCGSLSWNVTNNTYGNRDFQQTPIPYISGNKYTASWWSKGSGTQLFRVWNINTGGEVLRETWTLTTDWKYYTYTFTANDAMQNQSCTWHLGVTGSASINMCGMKLELGDKATPWVPNSADICWSPMGYNDTIEYDVSGYNYHGSTANVTYSSDSARYSVSSVFNGSSSRIYCGTIKLGNIWSYGIWYKSANVSSSWQAVITLNTSGGDTDLQLGFYICHAENRFQSSANGKYNAQIALPHDTNWHHFFATYDGSSLKTYMDGTLVNTTSITAALLARSNLTIGARCGNAAGTSFNTWFAGQLSDFRLYATVLTPTQIAELYNTALSLSNNGALLGYEFVEA